MKNKTLVEYEIEICKNNTQLIKEGSLPVIPCNLFIPADIIITDKRDIKEINRRIRLNLHNPIKRELYSINPCFHGIYTY